MDRTGNEKRLVELRTLENKYKPLTTHPGVTKKMQEMYQRAWNQQKEIINAEYAHYLANPQAIVALDTAEPPHSYSTQASLWDIVIGLG